MKEIKIADKTIGPGEPCFIIAEAGLNHNGKYKLAKKLVDAAAKAGADAVKFQTFKPEGVVTQKVQRADYQKKNMGGRETQYQMLKRLSLAYSDFIKLKKYCNSKGIIFLSTPHSPDAIDFLEELVPAYKFGSGDLTNIPALEYAAKKGKPIILGTGMAAMSEVKDAVKAIQNKGNNKIIALHCTTSYPCPPEEVNLKAMQTMQKELDCLIGYSDHTMGITAPIMAATLGAVILEKHFTLDRNLSGPDHKASLEPDELKEMVAVVREVEKALGDGVKKPTLGEAKIKKDTRKSIVAVVDIPCGSVITQDMVGVKRPGSGMEPKYLSLVLGKTAVQDIPQNELVHGKMLGGFEWKRKSR